jgi:hypothetical protein
MHFVSLPPPPLFFLLEVVPVLAVVVGVHTVAHSRMCMILRVWGEEE